ncbi:MAG: FAD-binding protein [FCB group bacterium]|nr:FAD-binding protein [FCB group bacterium]
MDRTFNIDSNLFQALRDIVGKQNLISQPNELKLYSLDALRFHTAIPGCVVLPESTQEVSECVKACFDAGVPFTARGSGTGLSGGALSEGGVIIELSRMNQILKVDPLNRLAVVQPGVVNAALSKRVKFHHLHFAPDPSSQIVSTIGGNVAENAGGPHTLKYGVTSDHILGQTVVLADGEIARFGGKLRWYPGYDLSGLFTGSEGTLGITTKVVVNLTKLPEMIRTFLLIFDELTRATDCVSAILKQGILPTAMEMLDHLTIRAVEAKLKPGFPEDAMAVLIVELDDVNCDLRGDSAKLKKLAREFTENPIEEALTENDRERLWRGRKHAVGSLGQLAPAYYTNDGVVPRNRLTDVFREIENIAEKFKIPIASFCHAGDGNIHPNVLYDPADPAQIETALKASAEIQKICVEMGGTISGEHGIGLEKKAHLHLMHSDIEIELMRNIKRVFDPQNLANPGKIFPAVERNSTADIQQHAPIRAGSEMNPILHHAPDNLTLRLKADADLLAVQAFLRPYKQFLPLGPFKKGTTVGNAVNYNLFGQYACRYGTVRNLLLNTKIRTGPGIINTGVDVMKNVSGYDLNKLVVGARGSLGELLEATFRIYSIPTDLDIDYLGTTKIISDGCRLILPPVMVEKMISALEEAQLRAVSVIPLGVIDIEHDITELGDDVIDLVQRLGGFAGKLKQGIFYSDDIQNERLMRKIKSVFDPQGEFPEYHG